MNEWGRDGDHGGGVIGITATVSNFSIRSCTLKTAEIKVNHCSSRLPDINEEKGEYPRNRDGRGFFRWQKSLRLKDELGISPPLFGINIVQEVIVCGVSGCVHPFFKIMALQ